MTQTDDWMEARAGWQPVAAILAALLAVIAGCASTPDPKPAGGPMYDPVLHQEIIHVQVDSE